MVVHPSRSAASALVALVAITISAVFCRAGTAGGSTTAGAGLSDCAKSVQASPGNRAFVLLDECPRGMRRAPDGLCYHDNPYVRRADTRSGLRRAPRILHGGLDPKRIALGRLLFFDPILSGDGTVSCAHCHHPDLGLADGRPLSMGPGGCGVGPARAGGSIVPRSAPSVWNVAFYERYFWDGRSLTLEDQALGPLFSPVEMNANPVGMEAALNALPAYRALFASAFAGEFRGRITADLVVRAIADFERTLVSLNSPYDRFVMGESTALTVEELSGFNVFRSFVSRCTECHTPPLFTNQEVSTIGAPDPPGRPLDAGRESLTGHPSNRGEFKIPGLRNIARTAPYMHSGGLANLTSVVEFYNEGGGRALPAYRDLPINWHVRRMDITPAEVRAVVAFLHTLTDESLLPDVPRAVPSGLPVVARMETRTTVGGPAKAIRQ